MTGVRHLSSAPCRLVKISSNIHQCRTLYVTALYTSTVHTSDRVLLQPMFFASSCDTFFLCRVKTVAMLITWSSRFKVVALYVWLTKYKKKHTKQKDKQLNSLIRLIAPLQQKHIHFLNIQTFQQTGCATFYPVKSTSFPAAYVCVFRYLKHSKRSRKEEKIQIIKYA